MNTIIYTGMIRLVTPCHSTIRCIHDCVRPDNLGSMENDGIITRTVYPEVPIRAEYTLSESVDTMRPFISSFRGCLLKKNVYMVPYLPSDDSFHETDSHLLHSKSHDLNNK